jgi:hypothetical protein
MRDLTTDQREAACDLADDLFAIMLRISDDPDLSFIPSAGNSTYVHVANAVSLLLRQLGVDPSDIAAVQNLMGDGSPAEEAIATVQTEKEG